jgi:hypothetical protein
MFKNEAPCSVHKQMIEINKNIINKKDLKTTTKKKSEWPKVDTYNNIIATK